MDICVEISDLQAATEVSLTVSLDGASSGKAGRKICDGLCVYSKGVGRSPGVERPYIEAA